MGSDEQDPAHRATHDEVTGLPNHYLLSARIDAELARLRRQSGCVAVASIAIDGFAGLAERHGRRAMDELAQAIAHRLGTVVRDGDLLGSIGPGELGVVLQAGSRPEAVMRVARRMHASLEEPFVLASAQVAVPLRLTASIGATVRESAGDGTVAAPDVDDADALWRESLEVRGQVEQAGGGASEIYDEGMRQDIRERFAREDTLHDAIRRAELRLRYQPIVSTSTGEVIGAEALLRWQHTSRLDAAGSFIATAETTGLIVPMGRWVLDEAWAHLRDWGQVRPGRRFEVHINVSARQLADDEFVDAVAELPPLPDPAARLCIEVPEAVMTDASDALLDRLRRLRNLGVRVAIDDFGGEFMSFASLRQLPMDLVKIDRSFIAGLDQAPPDTDIVGAIIDVAHRFGVEVVASGVETADQLDILRALGCDAAQGHLFAVPLAASELDGSLREEAASGAG